MAVPRIRTAFAHECAIRLCALIFFFAFLGNVIDGPILWLLVPPGGGFTAAGLVQLNQLGLLLALWALLRPRCWPALAACWCAWRATYVNGGLWFFDSWDTMLLEVGFLTTLLAVTLSLYDAEVDAAGEPGPEGAPAPGTALGLPLLAGPPSGARAGPLTLCSPAVLWSRGLAEASLTLVAFRLFLGAGLEKLRFGDACWWDLTCLYDFYEMQPGPNAAAWYFHTYTPQAVKSAMQFFAINVAECVMPFLLLGFAVSAGPLAPAHRRLCGSKWRLVRWPARFPARFFASAVIAAFVAGIFVSGNFAFLHPLSVVPLVASLGTVRAAPAARPGPGGISSAAKARYRQVAPWFVMALLVFAFLPSLRAYAWLLRASEDTGPLLQPLMSSQVVRAAAGLSLGIPYQRQEYFAKPVHSRNELALFADLAGEWVELDVPQKVGSPGRGPRQTSPLHRRFAWQWWFLPLGGNAVVGGAAAPQWLGAFLGRLCEGHDTAWAALEPSPAHGRRREVRRLAVQMYSYRFAGAGGAAWWVRSSHGNVSWPSLGSTRLERACG